MWKILSLTKTTDPVQEEGSYPGEGEEEEDPRDSRITTQKTHTSIVSIMGGDIAPKGAQKQKNMARKSVDEHRILNAMSVSPELLAAAIHELSTKSSPNSAVFTTTIIMETISAVFPQSQAIQPIQQPQPIREILPPPPDSSSRPQSSSGPQNLKALPSFGTIMPISGGSAMEFETKKQRSNHFRSVNTIINDGPAARPE
jgi:hypothetical protein